MEQEKKKGGGIEGQICIIGCNGLLGQKLCQIAAPSYSVYGMGRRIDSPIRDVLRGYVQVDVTHRGSVVDVLSEIDPDWVINTAAMTDVERCQREPEQAAEVNVDGLQHVVEGCRQCGAKLIHLSTDYVFDGTSPPYAEGDRTNPLNTYGRTKEASEMFLQQSGLAHIIVRTSLLYGCVPETRLHFVTWVHTSLEGGQRIRAATDLCGDPTFIDDLAVGILSALEKDIEGMVHMAGSEALSRYEWAVAIAETFELDTAGIEPVTFHQLGLEAPRPLRSELKTDRARDLLNLNVRTVGEGLRMMRKQWNRGGGA